MLFLLLKDSNHFWTILALTDKQEYEKFVNDCVNESLKEENFDDQDELFN